MGHPGNPIQHMYVRKVERRDGELWNTMIHTFPSVSQFWKHSPETFLKEPVYDRNYPRHGLGGIGEGAAVKAMVLRRPGGPVRLEDVPVPKIGPNGALLRVRATGVGLTVVIITAVPGRVTAFPRIPRDGQGSRAFARRVAEQPQQQAFFGALNAMSGGRVAPAAGGVLIRDGQGAVLGAVGISGDTSDRDEACALAGIAAAQLVADTG
jgi:hypothetical protein